GRVHEQGAGGRAGGEVERAAGAGLLDDVAVQAAARVDRSDDALGEHVLTCERARGAGALDLLDARLDGLARVPGIPRVAGIPRVGLAARRGGGGGADGEVGRVLAGRGDPRDGGGVRGARRGRLAGDGGRRAPADEVHDGGVLGTGRAGADEAAGLV